MGLDIKYEDGQTPLDENESMGLLFKTITTQGELNEAEQLNIEEAVEWTLRKKFEADNILSETFCNELHRKMYSGVWQWAGTFRKTNKNIGVDKYQIQVALRTLIEDCNVWIDHQTYPEDEIAVRFKHRIVSIHCYSNGNGRHSRLMADVIISHIFGRPVFTWGAANLVKAGEARETYLKALKAADKGDLTGLVGFARG
ncbi:MAG: mobile mystery protein B [Chitinophagaceae bacterium]